MPEPKGRKKSGSTRAGASKHQAPRDQVAPKRRRPRALLALSENRAWVPPTFITVGLLGVAWLVVYYIAGYLIPVMADLGGWNIAIGMGLMAAAFGIATLWK